MVTAFLEHGIGTVIAVSFPALTKPVCARTTSISGNQFVIGDLGVAVPFGMGGFPGNQINRAPELVGMDVTGNDVWAVGCLMFQIFQRSHPFDDPGERYLTRNKICDLPLPKMGAKWGLGIARLLELLWCRNVSRRISPQKALRLCGMLLWGFPLVGDHPGLHSGSDEEFDKVLRQVSGVDLPVCEQWLVNQRHQLFADFSEQQRGGLENITRLEIEQFLRLEFVMHSSAEMLLDCIRVFVDR